MAARLGKWLLGGGLASPRWLVAGAASGELRWCLQPGAWGCFDAGGAGTHLQMAAQGLTGNKQQHFT